MDLSTLAHRIKHARAVLGVSQAELARRCELGRESIAQWETNSCKPRLASAYRLAQALGVPIPWLLKGEGEAPSLRGVANG